MVKLVQQRMKDKWLKQIYEKGYNVKDNAVNG